MAISINGQTTVVGVFGDPVAHTASPPMHNAAFEQLGLNWVYLPFHVLPENLHSAVRALPALGIPGVNLTVPHKAAGFEAVDQVAPNARRLGVVNTIVVKNGRMEGYSTDGPGFSRGLEEDLGLALKGLRVVLLGTGGAGRAVAMQCAEEGVSELFLANRSSGKADRLAEQILDCFPNVKVEASSMTDLKLKKALAQANLVIQCTSVGLHAGDPCPVDPEWLKPPAAAIDLIYRPAVTPFLACAAGNGMKTANGLGMLLHQGALAFELWTEQAAPLEVMRQALKKAVYSNA
jgi:shikimate dehydrogenase